MTERLNRGTRRSQIAIHRRPFAPPRGRKTTPPKEGCAEGGQPRACHNEKANALSRPVVQVAWFTFIAVSSLWLGPGLLAQRLARSAGDWSHPGALRQEVVSPPYLRLWWAGRARQEAGGEFGFPTRRSSSSMSPANCRADVRRVELPRREVVPPPFLRSARRHPCPRTSTPGSARRRAVPCARLRLRLGRSRSRSQLCVRRRLVVAAGR